MERRLEIPVTNKYATMRDDHAHHYRELFERFKFLENPYTGNISSQTFKHKIGTAPDVIKNVVLSLKDRTSKLLHKLPKTFLFIGKPGVGKTFLAAAIAYELQEDDWMPLLVNSAVVCDRYVNSGEQNLNEFFNDVIETDRKYVVIFDEISVLAQRNKDANIQHDKDTASALWLGIDKLKKSEKFLILGTTNTIDKFPDPLLSRFHKQHRITIRVPDVNDRLVILKDFLHDTDIKNCGEAEYAQLANRTNRYTGRELVSYLEKFICTPTKGGLTYQNLLNSLPRITIFHVGGRKIVELGVFMMDHKLAVIGFIASGVLGAAYIKWQMKHTDAINTTNQNSAKDQLEIAKKQLELAQKQAQNAIDQQTRQMEQAEKQLEQNSLNSHIKRAVVNESVRVAVNHIVLNEALLEWAASTNSLVLSLPAKFILFCKKSFSK